MVGIFQLNNILVVTCMIRGLIEGPTVTGHTCKGFLQYQSPLCHVFHERGHSVNIIIQRSISQRLLRIHVPLSRQLASPTIDHSMAERYHTIHLNSDMGTFSGGERPENQRETAERASAWPRIENERQHIRTRIKIHFDQSPMTTCSWAGPADGENKTFVSVLETVP